MARFTALPILLFAYFSMSFALPVNDDSSKHWALLVAGSNAWYNYRHQADICHSFQILKAHGIPDERIVVMMYDDIAYNDENPTPGYIINRPNGTDVYNGVPHDFTGSDVTPQNFLLVLQGRSDLMQGIGTGKVINSGPNDHVFVYFSDHGAPGIIAFPDDELHAKDLNDVIESMHANQQYKQMVFYIEACESGSMFNGLLPDNVNVFATTAANGHESSYACYYDSIRNTYLGDVYSVKWMENSDAAKFNVETLEEQFSIVKEETKSHVQQFGDLSIASSPIAEFQAGVNYQGGSGHITYPYMELNPVVQEDVQLAIVSHKLKLAKTDEQRHRALAELEEIVTVRRKVDKTFEIIISMLSNSHLSVAQLASSVRHPLTQHQCYKRAVTAVSQNCFVLGKVDYALRHLYKLLNLCEEGVNIDTIELVINYVCYRL